MSALPERAAVHDVEPVALGPAFVRREYQALIAGGARLRPAGRASADPSVLLGPKYLPRYRIDLFGISYWLTDFKHDEALGFFVGYVVQHASPRTIWPRLFYKDSSLVWRVASHFIHDYDEYWMGKGAVRVVLRDGEEFYETIEETTNLPFEVQFAFDELSRRKKRVRDDDAVELVVRQAPSGRIHPYADFSGPREAAVARGESVNGGRSVATFRRSGDPTSLEFVPGFEPDLRKRAVLGRATVHSRFFGGDVQKVRLPSVNREVQFLFFASPTHTWLAPPQAMTTDLSPYGVRTIDVAVHDDLCVPGFEYHEANGPSQIPKGFAGPQHPDDAHRADAGPWLSKIPILRAFERKVL